MKFHLPTATALLASIAAGPAFAQPMAMDTPVNMGSLEIACTGVGSAKDDPQWSAYPVRIEFSNGAAQYLAGVRVAISQGSTAQADFECAGPWVLVKGPAGSYKVTASLLWEADKSSKSTTFVLGSGAQKRVVLQFGPTMPRSDSAATMPDNGTVTPSGPSRP